VLSRARLVANDLLGFGYGFLGYICFIEMLWLGNRGIRREWVQMDEKQWCLRWCCYSHCLYQFGECGVLKNMFIVSINVSAKLMMKFRVLRNDFLSSFGNQINLKFRSLNSVKQ